MIGGSATRGEASSRRLHLELLRGIGIVLVVYNHTGNRGFLLFLSTHNRFAYLVYLFLSIACKVAVPLFFMVSGALLIPKQETLCSLYKRRILRFVIVLLLFSLLQYWFTVYKAGAAFSVRDFLAATYATGVIVPYYFLYLYLALLVMLPFLRKMALGMSDREFLYLGALQVFLVGFVPIFEYLAGAGPLYLNIVVVVMNVFFFLMGHFLEERVGQTFYRKRFAILAAGASVALIALSGFMTWLRAHQTGDTSVDGAQTFHYGLIAVPAISAFYLAKYLTGRVRFPAVARSVIVGFGGTAFGIYLVERIFRVELDRVYTRLLPHLHSFPTAIVWVLAIVAASAAVTLVLKQIPLIKRLL